MSSHPPTLGKPAVAIAGTDHDALPAGTRFGEFEIVRVLGVGGFGIVYLARDHSLERDVALKEYMPASLAARGAGPQITIRSSAFAETYAIGLRSFINEARLLARFNHPSLVKVYRFWEDNATAYMVMPFLQGTTLRDSRRGMAHPPGEAWIKSVITPILSALELLHSEGVYHRDIAPDNILLPRDGPPVLLDFGAARRVISDRTQSLTAILKPSYAPIEQYAEMTQLRQGPWTDLYALGAVVHYLAFGAPPPPATARAVADDADAPEHRVVPGISARFLDAMSWMLAVRPNDRPQSGEQLRAVLDGRADIPPRVRTGTTIPGSLASAAAGGQLTQAADATRVDPAYTRTQMPPATSTATSFSPTTTMPTARAGLVTGATAAAAPAAQPASAAGSSPAATPATALSQPGVFAASRPATLAPQAPSAQAVAPTTPMPVSRPAPLAAGPAAAPDAPRRTRSKIALAAGAVVVVLALAAAIQFAGRRGAPAAAAAPTSANVAVPSTVPAPLSTDPSEVILDGPKSSAATAPTPAPVSTEPKAAALPSITADVAPGSRSAGSAERDALDAANAARTRPPGRPVPKVDDGAAGTTAGGTSPRAGDTPAGATMAAGNERPARARPTPMVEAEPATATEACAKLGGGFFARNVCLDEKCEEARYRNLGECPKVIARKRQREH